MIDISLLWLLLIIQQWDYLRYKLITRGWLMIPYILCYFCGSIKLQYFIFKLEYQNTREKWELAIFSGVFYLFQRSYSAAVANFFANSSKRWMSSSSAAKSTLTLSAPFCPNLSKDCFEVVHRFTKIIIKRVS